MDTQSNTRSTERAPRHTRPSINESIRNQIHLHVAHTANLGRNAITDRIRELDEEWDIERILEAAAGSLGLAGMLLGRTVNRRFYLLSGVVPAFLLQHAIQGWCPPLPILRRIGKRTRAEIDYERTALQALRGDFEEVNDLRQDLTLDSYLVERMMSELGHA